MAIAMVALFYVKRPGHAAAASQPAAVTNTPVIAAATPEPTVDQPVPKPRPKEIQTNDFAISSIRLEKTPGSSLVYVVGKVRNMDGQPRYGVKLEFGLSDAAGEPMGAATDYDQMLEPYGEWHFRALVLEAKAVSAHFRSIQETR